MPKEPLTSPFDVAKIDPSDLKVSERRSLKQGQLFSLSEGPYYVSEKGSRSKFGERGRFIFIGHYLDKDGSTVIVCRRMSDSREIRVLFRRSESASRIDGVVYRPYRIKVS